MAKTYQKKVDKFEKARKRLTNQVLNRIQKAFEENENEDFEDITFDRQDQRNGLANHANADCGLS